MMKVGMLVIAGMSSLMLAGCVSGNAAPNADAAPTPTQGAIGMPNPASVYCLKLGGKEINKTTELGVSTDCLLPTGERIDEWALYRRDHS
ncbi:hypothetical protein BN1044_00921 [Hafnia alvei]|uniref:DUF333 domain-containing protein n=2 Tax=Hafnia alvei TaxID=569 RepID=A0A1C6YXE5_HAFAL|nr:hypothetical protein BN1044_00921 [Hafnia alvei]